MPPTSAITTKPQTAIADTARAVLFGDGIAGIVARMVVVTAAMTVAFLVALMLNQQGLLLANLSVSVLLGIGSVIWLGMLLGVIFSEFPRGNEYGLARVGLATFCRTGLPLVIVLIAVSDPTRLHSVAAFTGIMYAVGLVVSLSLEVSKLGFSSANPASERE